MVNRFTKSAVGFLLIALSVVLVQYFQNTQPMLKAALHPLDGYLLTPLLKPRVPGTPGAIAARNHIKTQLEKAGWEVETHSFIADTPDGRIPMANVLAQRKGAKSEKNKDRLTLAAHYDSKKLPHGFIGATDSAFPCALMLYLASIQKTPKKDFDLIFFDGEEAFDKWTDEDSIYGAKALAELQARRGTLPSTLVLLDLLGDEARSPIPSWFPQTHSLHRELEKINPKLIGGRPLHEYAGMMQDDHLPFLQRGVPVLHLIPWAFPDAWHTMKDDASILHWETIEQWAELFEEWLF